MRESFREKRFTHSSRAIIDNANIIIEEHRAEGYTLTLRQLYYQFVHRKLIANSQKEYKRIGSVINDAKLAGLIDWDALEDRMRFLRSVPHYGSPAQFVEEQTPYFAENLWLGQRHYCEVWIEKDTLSGVIERPCIRYRVPFFACRGYASQSGLYEAGRRLRQVLDTGRTVTIFHLGDHDLSGLDMSRDNEERLNMFARTSTDVRLVRLALNQDQIQRFNLPPDPANLTDSYSAQHEARRGWELDALPSREIDRLIVSAIEGVLDRKMFDAALDKENSSRRKLNANWDSAVSGAQGAD